MLEADPTRQDSTRAEEQRQRPSDRAGQGKAMKEACKSIQGLLLLSASLRYRCSPSSAPLSSSNLAPFIRFPVFGWKISGTRRIVRKRSAVAMVQQAVQGAPAAYTKELERLSAEESLILSVSTW
ncbi:hypothetical protein SAY87_008998 [Trapa incisa]|uniref:Uncharacterized protein n=1 Tax=Trapa incisa TaxID=236973 RepID=A0AAN7JVY1_9MYRT|nr:hypothetical protein SAY87_008998 [Trapa incisa]